MLLNDLIHAVHDTASARRFLQERRILRSSFPPCPILNCDRSMTEVRRSGKSDGVMYRCPAHKSKTVSIRDGSFLAQAHITLEEFVYLAYLWAHETPNKVVVSMLGLAEHTVVDWYNMLREICSRYLILHRQQLGGPGVIVEIDESLVSKRKYNIGHLVPERWVFGAIDRTTNNSFLIFVEDRSAASLLPLIEQYIAPGSVIHSDGWAAYQGISAIPVIPPFTHETVNHRENFVNPINGATTNHIECLWKNAKKRLKTMCGTTKDLLPSHLDEFMWRQLRGQTCADAFQNIFTDISELFPVV